MPDSRFLQIAPISAALLLAYIPICKAQSSDPQPTARELPATGPVVQDLAPIDGIMRNAMTEHHVLSGTIAVTIDGKLVLREGYGWSDAACTIVTHPDTLFRLASVSKTLTHSAIEKLIQAGAIKRDMPVYPYLKIAPWGGHLGDERISHITVEQLLNHSGGWKGGGKPNDWVFRTVEISKAMKLDHPAGPREVISWVLSKPLDFAPGTETAYSNFGYMLLGRVIEKASGKTYVDYIQQELLNPAAINNPIGFKNIIQSRSRPRDLNAWETWYTYKRDRSRMPSAVDYPKPLTVPFCEGGYFYESFDAFGGLTASAAGLSKYLQTHWCGGGGRDKHVNYRWTYTFFGELPGAATAIHQDITQNAGRVRGLEFVVLFNGGTGQEPPSNAVSDALLEFWKAHKPTAEQSLSDHGEVQWQHDHEITTPNQRSTIVRLVRSGNLAGAARVSYAMYKKDSSPRAQSTSGIVEFLPHESQKEVTITLGNGAAALSHERLFLELISASEGASLGNRCTCVVTYAPPILSKPGQEH